MLTPLWANLVHGLVALLWASGVRRLLAPRSPAFTTSLLALCVVMPVVVGLGRLLAPAAGEGDFTIFRVGAFVEALTDAAPPLGPIIWVLVAGTAGLFVAQELARSLSGVGVWRQVPRAADAELEALVGRLATAYRTAGLLARRCPTPPVVRLETDRPVAQLSGFRRPTILVSRGIVSQLDAEQLEGVLAHELAHLVFGGNRRLLFLWVLRGVQAASPAALVLFRTLTVTLEGACDVLAVRITGRPAALASALLSVHRAQVAGRPHRVAGADRADRVLLERRVRDLLALPPGPTRASVFSVWAQAGLLGGLLWFIR